MIREMMKLANAKNKNHFLKMFPTEASFLKKHGGEFFEMMYGGSYAEGGAPQEMMQQQMAPQQGGGQDDAMRQIVEFIMQSLEQKMPIDQIIAKLIEMTGMPQDQAVQIVQMIVQKISGGGGQEPNGVQEYPTGQEPPQEEMAEAPQAQGPQEEMMEQGPPPQGMRMGGTPCYECGGKYKKGGSYSGTYNAATGAYFSRGGAYVPDYSQYAYGGYYPTFAGGGEPCPPGYVYDGEVDDCVKLPEGVPQPGQNQQNISAPSISSPNRGGGFNAGVGLEGKRYNLDYGFGVGADMKSDVLHNLSLNLPGLFRAGANKGDLDVRGMYAPGRNWSGNLTAGFPLSGKKGRSDLLRFTGGIGQRFNDPELDAAMNSYNDDYMKINQQKNPVNYNAGLEYVGKMFGERGPNVKIRASYDKQKYGGTPSYKKGGEYEMTQEEIQDLINKGYKIQYI